MEIFVLLIVVPIVIGLFVAFGAAVFAVISSLIIGAISLSVSFWYVTLSIMLVLLAPVIYLNGWLAWFLIPVAMVAVAIFFAPLSEEQKAEIQRAKELLKNS